MPLVTHLNFCNTMFKIKTDMKNQFQSLTQDNAFMDAVGQLPQYVDDTNADCDMAYDWVCEMANCSSFVADKDAWDYFYDMWSNSSNRIEYNFA
jgi:hypothetical protein